MNILECIDNINITEDDAFNAIMESYWCAADKALEMMEYNPSIFQEGVIDDASKDVKVKELYDDNKVVTVLLKIPRMIIALIKRILEKFKKHPEGLSESQVNHVHQKMNEIIEKAKNAKKDKLTLNEKLGVVAVATGSGLLITRKVLKAKQNKEIKSKASFETNYVEDNQHHVGLDIAKLENGKVFYLLPNIDDMETLANKLIKISSKKPDKAASLLERSEKFNIGKEEKDAKTKRRNYHWVNEKDIQKYQKKFVKIIEEYNDKVTKKQEKDPEEGMYYDALMVFQTWLNDANVVFEFIISQKQVHADERAAAKQAEKEKKNQEKAAKKAAKNKQNDDDSDDDTDNTGDEGTNET